MKTKKADCPSDDEWLDIDGQSWLASVTRYICKQKLLGHMFHMYAIKF